MGRAGVSWAGRLASIGACAASALFALGGCDQRRIEQLEEGVSTEADVRRQFGEPAAVFDEPGGARTLDYPRQPEGLTNYFVTIGPDGVMTALRQVLKPASFAKVVPGLGQEQVRRLLGRPGKMQRYALKRQEEWTWRWADGPTAKEFNVVFDADGRDVSSSVGEDTKNTSH
jgi:outer membrane protein assembly factor BamE (lipoprotein component of BamABCDE complex)